jgi:hypothetical protein
MVIYHSFFRLDAFGIKLRSLEKIYCLYMSYASTCIYPELCPSSNKLLKYYGNGNQHRSNIKFNIIVQSRRLNKEYEKQNYHSFELII